MKKHNPDYLKNRDADVIKHGNGPTNPNEHWEIRKNITPEGNSSGWGAFLPRQGKNRPTPHVKVNETDY